MFFKLPFRTMYRPPRKSHGATVARRRQGQADAHAAAEELAESPDVIACWKRGDTTALMTICKNKEWEVGAPAFTSATMIFTSLSNILKRGDK